MFTLRWGIVSTGWMSNKFILDLLIDPSTRQVTDVSHVVRAVGSRSLEKAQEFVQATWKEAGASEELTKKISLYGTYQELYEDPDVDCVYIGSPHSHHYQHAHAALSAGKNVLCEKSLVVNGDQAQILVDLARKKNVFFMEAVWTRFQPVAYKFQEILKSGVLGEIRSVVSELCVDNRDKDTDAENRLTSPNLAGGALLDLGPYPWTWLALALLPPSEASTEPLKVPQVAASMIKSTRGVDLHTAAVIAFPQADGRIVHGTLLTSLNTRGSPSRTVIVHGSKGLMELSWATYRPERLSYSAWETEDGYATFGMSSADEVKPAKQESFDYSTGPGGAWGYVWEADEVARCVRDGKKESTRMPLNETVLMMRVFDQIRKIAEFLYPEALETTEIRDF